MKKRAEITFEVEESISFRQTTAAIKEFCPNCQATSVMTTPEILASMTDSSEREIFRLIEAGAIYFTEGTRLTACMNCYRRLLTAGNEPRCGIPELKGATQ